MRDLVAEPQKLCRQDRYPPLQKTQGRGTLTILHSRWRTPTSSKGGLSAITLVPEKMYTVVLPPVTFSILSPEPSYALASVDTQQTGWARYREGPAIRNWAELT